MSCTHLDQIEILNLPEDISGCEDCLATGHPIVRSAEPGEEWSWCYVDEVAFVATTR